MVSGEYRGFYYAFGTHSDCPDGFICVSPSFVFGPRHVLSSIMTAIDAITDGYSVARDVHVEFLVRLTGKRQISEAMKAKGRGVIVWIGKEPAPSLDLGEIESRPDEMDAIERRLLL